MNYFTKGISFIFHPIFMPMLAFFVYLQIDHFSVSGLRQLADDGFWIIFSAIALFTFLLPLIALNGMIATGIVQDWEIKHHKERVPVMIITALFLACLYYIFSFIETKNGQVFYAFFGIIMSGVVSLLLAAIISNFWKISIHSIGISSLAGSLIGITSNLEPLINTQQMIMYNSIILGVVGLVGFARLYEKAHNLPQVIAGIIIGFSASFIITTKELYW